MSDLLRIGAQGVAAYRGAMSVTGENVANANTDGYHRRSVSFRDQSIVGVGDVFDRRDNIVGGVSIASVSRATNAFIEAEGRLASSETAGMSALARWLTTSESALSSASLPDNLSALYSSAETLAGDPRSNAQRGIFLARIDDTATAFRAQSEALARVAESIASEAFDTVEAANGDLTALADINRAIIRSTPGTSAHAGLIDQRDRLLTALGEKIGVDTTFDARGTVKVNISGGGPVLVDGTKVAPLAAAQASDGRIAYYAGGDQVQVQRGSLAGLAQAAVTVADMRRATNNAAESFIQVINDWSTAGTDANGDPGAPLLTVDMRLTTTDPAKVAAASGGVANGNALALGTGRAGHGIEETAQGVVDTLALRTSTAKGREAALIAHRDQIDAARGDVSGVDLDREAAELLRYQQAYDASSRVIQIARETLQSILSIF